MDQPDYNIPANMKAIAIDRFGGAGELKLQTLPVPEIVPDEVLIRIEWAGLGSWDVEEREGQYAEYLGEPTFPYVLGWEGAGRVAAVGERVSRFKQGDRVYAANFPKHNGGGFYAMYAAVKADCVSHIPENLPSNQAGVMTVDAITALTGLDNVLNLKQDQSLMIFGASGGIGHMAVQLAKQMGARVFAVASGDDGVEFVQQLGADVAVDGRREDVVKAAKDFAPEGLDKALATAGGEAEDRALTTVREGGRVIYPNGVIPKPNVTTGINLQNYDMLPIGRQSIDKLTYLINEGPFKVHIGGTFLPEEIKKAHRALDGHYLGKLVLTFPNGED
ncbi:NADPH:quinone reductase [Fodinibius roseus]|uniref:NADPH:quinone reductase n=1 Tax=Fodinibius roseus TaxID=1194090 RepID=A0A1M4YU38_9BACT|nr:NADP-dependent oxidoreductase [Fodinibius roseus]SHF09228.1 NADPH:quinone reductase [Fodinibius roseus]